MRKTHARAALAAAALATLVLAACGDDDGDGGASDTTVAPATTVGVTVDSYVAAMTPLCETLDTTANEATAPLFASEEEPDGAAAQEALGTIATAVDEFTTAAAAIPAPAEAAGIVPGYQAVGDAVEAAAATPESALAFFEADDPRAEVAKIADSIGLAGCGSGGTFAMITEVPLSAAPADAIAIEAFDYGWKGLPAQLPAGETNFVFSNAGKEDHEFVMLPLAPDTDTEALLESLTTGTDEEVDALGEEVAAGPPGGMYAGPGGSAAGVTELQPGNYAVVCFIPDAAGKAHRQLGMAVVVEVV